jgi:NAD kinase
MIKGLLITAIVIFALNGVYQVTAPLIKNTMLEGKMDELAKNHARKAEGELHAELMDFVKDKGINLNETELMVHVGEDGKVLLAARYGAQARFMNYSRSYVFFPASSDKARLYWNQFRRQY